MPEPQEHIDEYLLAAFLAGDLPQRLREEISAYLVTNDRARDLLAMAGDALYAADSGDGARSRPGRKLRPARLDVSDMLAARQRQLPRLFSKSEESLWKTIIVVASTVLLLTIAVAWHISTDLRAPNGSIVNPEWVPNLADNRFLLEWEEVTRATAYRVILHDNALSMPHAVGLTSEPVFDATQSEEWPAAQASGGPHVLWIEALDADGNLIQRSVSIPVSRP